MTPHRIINHGFVTPRITQDHYVFGAELIPEVEVRPDGQYLDFLSVDECQRNGAFETYGCTVFGTLNSLEILEFAKYGNKPNFSDRFTYITSETSPPGNDPHVVAETIRKTGTIPDAELPFSADIKSLDSFRDMGLSGPRMLQEGLLWVETWDFMHEWLFTSNIGLERKQKIIMDCLRYSPVGVSVRAWMQRPNGLYFKNSGESDTHWTVIVGYVEHEYWIVYDSYPNSEGSFLKRLEWDYDFGFAKRYHLEKKIQPVVEKTCPLINWFSNLFAK